jgi:threonine dehydrogenase-like Zn-dependent dehydrogenase
MKDVSLGGPRNLGVGDPLDRVIQHPSDVVVRVTLTCLSGTDAWYW